MKARQNNKATVNKTKTSSAGLEEGEQRFISAFENMLEGVQMLGHDWRYLYLNPAAEVHNRRPNQELLGNCYMDMWPGIEDTHIFSVIKHCLEQRIPAQLENCFVYPDGQVGWFNLSIQPIPEGVLILSFEITERIHAEKRAIQMKRLYAALSQVNQTIVRVKDHMELYQSICDVAVKFGEFSVAWIGLLDEVTGEVKPVAANGLDVSARPMPITNIHTSPLSDGLLAQAFHSSHVVTSADVQANEHLQSLHKKFGQYGFHSSAVVPFHLRDSTIGVLTLLSQEIGLFQAIEERHLLEEMGLDISFALDTMETRMERRRAEEALTDREEQYRLLANNMVDFVSTSDLAGNPTYVSSSIERALGYSFAELQSLPREVYMRPESIEEIDRVMLEEIAKELEGGADPNRYRVLEVEYVRRDGSHLICELKSSAMRDGDEYPIGVQTIGRDITERKQAEDSIRLAEQQYRLLFEESPVMVVLTEYDNTNILIAKCNQAFLSTLGYHPDEVLGKSLTDFYSAGSKVKLEQTYLQTIMGAPLSEERELIARDGRIVPVLLRAVPRVNAEGDVMGTQASYVDITERKRADDKLLAQTERLDLATRSAEIGIWDWDVQKNELVWDDRMYALYGIKPGDFGGAYEAWLKGLYEDDRESGNEVTNQALRGEKEYDTEFRVLWPDGSIHWLKAEGQVYWDQDHNPLRMVGINYDITERKQAEREINWLASFPGQNPNPIVEIDSTGAVFYMNPRAHKLFPDLATQGFKHPWLHGLETIMDRLRQGEIQQLQREVQVGDSWYSQPVYYVPDDERLRVYGTDITERMRTEEKLRESERTLKLFVEYAPAAIAMFDRDMKYIAASQRYLVDYRLGEQVVVGRSHYEIFPDVPQRWKEIHRRCMAGAIEKEEEDPFPRADGRLDWVRWEIRPWHEATGEIGGIILFSEVITGRKQAEAALRIENERFQRFVESNIVGIVIANAAGKIITANDYYLNILGVTRQDFENGTVDWRRFTPPEWLPVDEQALHELSERGVCEPYEKEYMRADGRRAPVYIANAMLPGSDQQIAAFVLDISERKQAERALRESGSRIDAIIASAMDAIISIDDEQRILLLNASAEQMFRCSAADMIGQPLERFIPGRFHAAHRTHVEQYGRDGTTNRAMGRMTILSGLRSDGEEFPIEVSISQVTVAGKKVFTAILRDVTARRQAEEKIQRQLDHLNSLRSIDTAISSSFDLPVILDVVLQQVLSQLGVDASAILLINDEMQTVNCAASRGFGSDALQYIQMKLGEGYSSQAILERRTTHILNLMETTGNLASSLLERESFVEYYGTPLIVKGEVKGVLEIYHRSHLWTDVEWLEFLETLAGQAAIAIDNAQMFENLQRSNTQLEQRVTERTLQLNRTNAELEHANRAKDEFLAAMSHELRTPLNSILGLSETLLEQRRDPLTAYQERSLRIVQSSGSHLLELINDILDLSKIEAGKFTHYPDVISISETCRSSLAFVREQAVHKSITITYEQEADVSTMYADPRRLKQILINLLNNAVKFTPERGHVTLQVHADPGQDRIQFSVIDTGIGIALEDLRQLFVPFKQVDSRLTRDYEGTGLGLALVQKLTDLHGGSVDVESEVGKGSRFTINLPLGLDGLAQEEFKEISAERLPDTPAAKSNTRVEEQPGHWIILLAEDNAANVLTIGDYLENYGYQVVVAHDGLEALDKAEQAHPDIILMDIQMPVMDGLESMRRLRANPRFASTPIIALTAIAMPGDRERCLKAGANEYMSKPASLKKLVTSIKQLLRTQG